MSNSPGAIARAKTVYFFKETFRAHSKAEYKEIFSRGLNEDNGGITGAHPWMYVRAFFALFILFTINILILRFTNNTLYVPSVTFLGGITFIIPFIIFLFELYPKRDISLFFLFAVLVVGGTLAGALTQLCYYFVEINNKWLNAVFVGAIEEFCKIIPAIIFIEFARQKNAYACFLLAAAVGAGFSVIEDMGYIFYYSDKYAFSYHSDIQATIAIFLDRGMSTFCTHIIWTGIVGWAYSLPRKPFRSVWLIFLAFSAGLHICWDLPLDGFAEVAVILACVAVGLAVSIAIIHNSRMKTITAEIDLTRINDAIVAEAKAMGERLRFTNAANLTFALTCMLLSVIVVLLCALPIGMEYQSVTYNSKEEFIAYIQGDYNLKADFNRKYDENGKNYEERLIDGKLTYVVQRVTYEGYDGEYYYGYYASDKLHPDSISVELEGVASRVNCVEYQFGKQSEWVFNVHAEQLKDYSYDEESGAVIAVTDAEEFEGYDVLIAFIATACAISGGCAVILIAFRIKLRRVRDVRL